MRKKSSPQAAPLYAWKRMTDGEVSQAATAASADELFEKAGFGAVDTDKPIKGYLAVAVTRRDGVLVESR